MLKVAALVLAAGLSSRMPVNKMLLELSGKTIIQRTVENILASGLTNIKVVVGSHKEEIKSQLTKYKIDIVENAGYNSGMSTSIKAGMDYFSQSKDVPDAAMIFLGDMPFIKPETINQILLAYVKRKHDLIVPVQNGSRGHPVLFGKKYFHMLIGLSGDSGARTVFSNPSINIYKINVNDPGIHIDIDCWDDYLLNKTRYEADIN